MSSSKDTEKKLNQNIDKASGIAQDNIDKASSFAQDEVSRLRAELDDLRRKAGPKMHEAENYLTSPCALGFYQGVVTGVVLVLAYAKWNGGLRI
ncbi:hypothetical protein LRAMOSA09373 [Lichtheimia ramosa]|uniref:Uncharacterized protein n=1 Tax=Lichtheimia ramosa TaxID=688394 RepID=A0A077WIE7_9FUNG|nr:hypothetical protein LRAMOSA09373 [Lichtheimia ramosa]